MDIKKICKKKCTFQRPIEVKIISLRKYLIWVLNITVRYVIVEFFILTWGHTYWFEREGKGRRETGRETLMWERSVDQMSVAFHTHPNRGLNPQPRHLPWLGIKLTDFWFTEQCSNQATLDRAKLWNFWDVLLNKKVRVILISTKPYLHGLGKKQIFPHFLPNLTPMLNSFYKCRKF